MNFRFQNDENAVRSSTLKSSMKLQPVLFRFCLAFAWLVPLLANHFAFGWGSDGHRMINQVAMETLPATMPAFLRSHAAIEEAGYLGQEPDRWRSSLDPELNEAQAPDHFVDLEWADHAEPDGLPPMRYQFIRDLYRTQAAEPQLQEKFIPERVGFLPWRATEDFERLRADMRIYRACLAAHQPTAGVEQAILYDAGILGHFVADGSQPLHTTVNYNGWAMPENPEGFTRLRGIHSQFESDFVHANIRESNIRALVPPELQVLNVPFQDFLEYLRTSHSQVKPLYRLEKAGGFVGQGTSASRSFTADRLAAGATMLRDMIVTAWIQSAQSSDRK